MSFNEFVQPIVSVVEPLEECRVKHFLDINQAELGDFSKIILSGTTLKDHATLNQLDKFSWIKTLNKPILGICAGIQTISLALDQPLSSCLQVGMTEIVTQKENPLFSGTFNDYALHNFSVEPSQNFEVLAKSAKCVEAVKHRDREIWGLLFHPEVRN